MSAIEPYLARPWQGRSGMKCHKCNSDTVFDIRDYSVTCLHAQCRARTLTCDSHGATLIELEHAFRDEFELSLDSKGVPRVVLIWTYRKQVRQECNMKVCAMRFTLEHWRRVVWRTMQMGVMPNTDAPLTSIEPIVVWGVRLMNDARSDKIAIEYEP